MEETCKTEGCNNRPTMNYLGNRICDKCFKRITTQKEKAWLAQQRRMVNKTCVIQLEKRNPKEETLIKDIIKIFKKYDKREKIAKIMRYWEIGARVNKLYGKPSVGSSDPTLEKNIKKGIKGTSQLEDSYRSLVEKLQQEGIRITRYDLRQARRFASEYDLKKTIKESNVSWSKIRRKIVKDFGLKKEPLPKSDFNANVLINFKKWNRIVNDFCNKGLTRVNFKAASKPEKEKCVKIIKNNIKLLQRRLKEIEK